MSNSSWNPGTGRPETTLDELKTAFETIGADVPTCVSRGLQLLDLADQALGAPPPAILEMDDGDVASALAAYSVRLHTADNMLLPTRDRDGLDPGRYTFVQQLIGEVLVAAREPFADLLISRRPEFDSAATAMMTASQVYGFTMTTTSDYVIDLADDDASAAWRATRPAWRTLNRYHVSLSVLLRLLGLEPVNDRSYLYAAPNLSVYFAAGDNWSNAGGYYLDIRTDSSPDWFALAAGGLRLNTPDEVQEKALARRQANAAALHGAVNSEAGEFTMRAVGD